MLTTAFRGMNPLAQLMFAAFIMVASVLIFVVAGTLAAIPFFGTTAIMSSLSAASLETPEGMALLKYFQVMQSIGLFVVPPFVLARLYDGHIGEYLKINRSTGTRTFVLAALSLLLVIPFINFLGAVNSQMSFPEAFSGIENWMRNMEDSAAAMVEKFMKVDHLSGLLFNIFMIAIIPALGEELMFRGVIQRIFTSWTRNYHWGIWITAFLFSAMHLQFYGFLPRMVLGAMFGYLLVWTGTMWVPILAHFVNNAVGVLGYYLINQGVLTEDVEKWGTGTEQIPILAFSFASVGFLLFLICRNQAQTKMPANPGD